MDDVGPLKFFHIGRDPIDETLRVCNMGTGNGSWNFEWLESQLPQTVLARITAIMPPSHDSGPDRLIWRWMLKGKFSSASTYSYFLSRRDLVQWKYSTMIWKNDAPQRVKNFLWLLLRNHLLPNEVRVKRRMSDEGGCPRCNELVETGLHAVRDCPFAVSIWKSLMPQQDWSVFFYSSLENWIKMNLLKSYSSTTNGGWPTLFSIVSWLIWKHRNDFIFKGDNYSSRDLIATSITWARSIYNSARLNTKKINILIIMV